MVFQKILDTKTNQVHAIEVLTRWNDSELGSITPEEILHVAKLSNQLDILDDYLIESALKSYRNYMKSHKNHSCVLSLNMTSDTFLNQEYTTRLSTLVKKLRLKPEMISIEVSEAMFSNDLEKCIQAIEQYKKAGFLIALDDFGKAYSSLGILNKIPYDYVKIDRSLISDISNLKTLEIIKMLQKIIEMSHKELIIEGVETKEQYDVLIKEGCTYMQGFYLHKPERFI